MTRTDTVRPAWIFLYGRECAERLQTLVNVAGEDAMHRFLSGKLGAAPFSGLYVRSVLEQESGRSSVRRLLDELLQCRVIPVASLEKYEARNPDLLAGMQLCGSVLIDVLTPVGGFVYPEDPS